MLIRSPVTTGGQEKTAQLRVKQAAGRGQIITAYGTSGPIFFETPTRAKMLIETGAFELLNGQPMQPVFKVGPSGVKPTGPAETKEVVVGESSPVAPDGRSTDSASSAAPGSDVESSSSAAGQASTTSKSEPSKPRGRPPKDKKHT